MPQRGVRQYGQAKMSFMFRHGSVNDVHNDSGSFVIPWRTRKRQDRKKAVDTKPVVISLVEWTAVLLADLPVQHHYPSSS